MKKMSMSEAGKLGAIASLSTHKKNKEFRVESYNKNPTRCHACNFVFSYESRNKKFCNSSCAAKTNNIGIARNKRKFSKSEPFKYCSPSSSSSSSDLDCLNCNKSLNKKAAKFCSRECLNEHRWKLRKQQISSSGKVDEIRQAKKYLKEVRGNSCEMCGIDTWAGTPILLLCDHINGNSSDWNLNNLRLICSNCDATTPYYKNKNKGNGRSYRRERYKLGKSF